MKLPVKYPLAFLFEHEEADMGAVCSGHVLHYNK